MPPLQPPPGRASGNIAERLRRARQERGMSLDELSVKTRIPVRHLETIEAGRGPDLPGGFIGKSFVRQYAAAVGLDGEQALHEFITQTGINLEVAFEERKISPYTPESIQKFQSRVWRNVAIGVFALMLLVVGLVYYLTRPAAQQADKPVPSVLPPANPEPADSLDLPAGGASLPPEASPARAGGRASASRGESGRGAGPLRETRTETSGAAGDLASPSSSRGSGAERPTESQDPATPLPVLEPSEPGAREPDAAAPSPAAAGPLATQ